MRHPSYTAFLAALLFSVAGCQSLVLQPDDSAGVTTGKVIGRTFLGISTLGLSEIWYARRRALESWLGHHINEVVAAWGPPSDVTEGYGGTRFFTWYRASSYTVSGQAHTYCNGYGSCSTTYSPPHAPKDGALFVNPLGRKNGRRYSANALTLEWARAAKACGVIASLYEGTKHSTASAAINGGMALDAIQAALGHADVRSTKQYAKRAALPSLASATAALPQIGSQSEVGENAGENGGAGGTRTRNGTTLSPAESIT